MTHKELEAIRRRCEAAAGPRQLSVSRWYDWVSYSDKPPYRGATIGISVKPDEKAIKNTAEFIAHAHEDVPTLVAEVERLRSLIELVAKEAAEEDQ